MEASSRSSGGPHGAHAGPPQGPRGLLSRPLGFSLKFERKASGYLPLRSHSSLYHLSETSTAVAAAAAAVAAAAAGKGFVAAISVASREAQRGTKRPAQGWGPWESNTLSRPDAAAAGAAVVGAAAAAAVAAAAVAAGQR